MNIKRFLPYIWAAVLTFLVFWQFFVKGYIPMPASFMVAWYEPFKSDTAVNGVPTIVHKAVGDDIFRQIYPLKALAANAFSQFRLPLWNPYGGAGQPLMANLHPGYLNPFSFVMVASEKIGWAWYVMLQLPLLFLSTFWYMRSIKLSTLASTFGGTVMVLSGISVTRYMYGDYMYAMSMLPLLLLSIECFRERKIQNTIFIVPLATTFLCVSVQPQISIYVLLCSAIYAGIRLRKHPKDFWIFSGLLLLGFGIAAVQLLPTIDLLKNANVTTQSSAFIFEKFLMPWSHLITILIPNYFGNSGTYNFWGKTDYIETVFSIGLIPFLFAVIAIFKKKELASQYIFFIIVSVLTILLTLDWWFPRILYSLPLPILSTNIPTRIYLLSTFAIAVLSAIGFHVYEDASDRQRKKFLVAGISLWVVVSILVALVYKGLFLGMPCKVVSLIDCKSVAFRNSLFELGVYSIFLFGLWISTVFKQKIFQRMILYVGCVLVIGSGVYNAGKILPMSPQSYVMPTHDVLTRFRDIAPSRAFGFSQASVATDLSSYYRYMDPNYYDPLYIKRYGEFVSYVNTGDLKKGLTRSDVMIVNDEKVGTDLLMRRQRAFDLLGVSLFLYRRNNTWLFTDNISSLSRARMVYKTQVEPDTEALLRQLFNPAFSYTDTVLIEEKIPYISMNIDTTGSVKIAEYLPERVRIEVKTANEGLLVLSDTYERGWKATVDGKATHIYRTNYVFRSIVIPKGDHEVIFIYDPWSVRVGLAISIASLVSVLLFGIGMRYGKIKV